ncbi:MAG: 16S rRNA (guanine(527)-N(7))-methyltransferase RsmG [Burkholderiaceae bacterium]
MATKPATTNPLLAAELASGINELGLSVHRAQQACLIEYVSLLDRWNRTYNLTAIREPSRMISHHLLDSLAVLKPLQTALPGPAGIVDIGAGGGLPGVVLAIAWPEVPVVLIEPVSKKCAFLRQCAVQLHLDNLSVVEQRVQHVLAADLPDPQKSPNIFISRAYTRLLAFAQQALPLCLDGSLVAAMKSALVTEEVAELGNESLTRAARGDEPAVGLSLESVQDFAVPGIDAPRSLVLLRAGYIPAETQVQTQHNQQ